MDPWGRTILPRRCIPPCYPRSGMSCLYNETLRTCMCMYIAHSITFTLYLPIHVHIWSFSLVLTSLCLGTGQYIAYFATQSTCLDTFFNWVFILWFFDRAAAASRGGDHAPWWQIWGGHPAHSWTGEGDQGGGWGAEQERGRGRWQAYVAWE